MMILNPTPLNINIINNIKMMLIYSCYSLAANSKEKRGLEFESLI